jgi:hypothetical protein
MARAIGSPDVLAAWDTLTDATLREITRAIGASGAHLDDQADAIGGACVLTARGATVGQAVATALRDARRDRLAREHGATVQPVADVPESARLARPEPTDVRATLATLATVEPRSARILSAVLAHATAHRGAYSLPAAAEGAGMGKGDVRRHPDRVRMASADAYAGWRLMLAPTGRRGDMLDRDRVAVSAFRFLTRARGVAGSAVWQDGARVKVQTLTDGTKVQPVAGQTARVPFLAPDVRGTADVPDARYSRSRKGRTYRADRSPVGVAEGVTYGAGTVGDTGRDTFGTLPAVKAGARLDTADRVAVLLETAGAVTLPDRDGAPVSVRVAGSAVCPSPVAGGAWVTGGDGLPVPTLDRCGCAGRRGVLAAGGTHAARPRAARRTL